jgi:copper chaperone CopZ
LSQAKIIVVSVNGMVCDFCARGIEKIFKRDADLIKINVDLNIGKVLIAYKQTKEIDEKEIRMAIQNSGQEVVKIDILQ